MSEKQGTPIVPPLNGGGGNNGGSNGGAPQQTVSLQQVLATAQSLNVLTGSGQQFVISSVPGLTQVSFNISHFSSSPYNLIKIQSKKCFFSKSTFFIRWLSQ